MRSKPLRGIPHAIEKNMPAAIVETFAMAGKEKRNPPTAAITEKAVQTSRYFTIGRMARVTNIRRLANSLSIFPPLVVQGACWQSRKEKQRMPQK